MKVILTKVTDLTGVPTAIGTELEVTPEYGRELIESGHAREKNIIERVVDKIEHAVKNDKKETSTIKNKDN